MYGTPGKRLLTDLRHPLLTVVLALLVFSYVSAAQKPATKYIYANRSLLVKENPLEKRTPAKKPEYVAHKAGDLTCRPFGECSPCPKDEVGAEPFMSDMSTMLGSSNHAFIA